MINNSPFLPTAPIYDAVIKDGNTLTDAWKNHFDSITQTTGYVIAHDRFNDTKDETPITQMISMTTARRNQLENAVDGSIIYNTTTNRFNFRENGAWVTFTPIPA